MCCCKPATWGIKSHLLGQKLAYHRTKFEKYVGYLKDDNVKLLSNVSKSGNNYCVLIGPEGDFTLEEIDDALDSGFQCISLGKSRLRTETAGMVACHALNMLNQ